MLKIPVQEDFGHLAHVVAIEAPATTGENPVVRLIHIDARKCDVITAIRANRNAALETGHHVQQQRIAHDRGDTVLQSGSGILEDELSEGVKSKLVVLLKVRGPATEVKVSPRHLAACRDWAIAQQTGRELANVEVRLARI